MTLAVKTDSDGLTSAEWNAIQNEINRAAKATLSTSTGTDGPTFEIFGGTGADGALNVTSGTTQLTGNRVYNFTSINISAGAVLTVSGTGDTGRLLLKCSGDCTIAGTISLGGGGYAGGNGGSPGVAGSVGTPSAKAGTGGLGGGLTTAPSTAGGGGGGGAYAIAGTVGVTGSGGAGGAGGTFDAPYVAGGAGGGGGGGASGGTGNNYDGTAGGVGGGALYLEVLGAINFTGSINAVGTAAIANTGLYAGAGGGGAGGMVVIIVGGTKTSVAGTITVTGGAGGVATSGANGGAGAAGYSVIV